MRIDEKKEVRLTGDRSMGSVRLGAQKSRWWDFFLAHESGSLTVITLKFTVTLTIVRNGEHP